MSVGGGPSSLTTLAAPPSPAVRAQRTMPRLGSGQDVRFQSPAPAPLLRDGPLCEGLGSRLSSTLAVLSDFALFW